MSVFGSIGSFFKKIGIGIGKAFIAANGRGLTDEVVALAMTWARVAAGQALSNDEKREFVVRILMNRGIPESIARLAVELGYQAIKQELGV